MASRSHTSGATFSSRMSKNQRDNVVDLLANIGGHQCVFKWKEAQPAARPAARPAAQRFVEKQAKRDIASSFTSTPSGAASGAANGAVCLSNDDDGRSLFAPTGHSLGPCLKGTRATWNHRGLQATGATGAASDTSLSAPTGCSLGPCLKDTRATWSSLRDTRRTHARAIFLSWKRTVGSGAGTNFATLQQPVGAIKQLQPLQLPTQQVEVIDAAAAAGSTPMRQLPPLEPQPPIEPQPPLQPTDSAAALAAACAATAASVGEIEQQPPLPLPGALAAACEGRAMGMAIPAATPIPAAASADAAPSSEPRTYSHGAYVRDVVPPPPQAQRPRLDSLSMVDQAASGAEHGSVKLEDPDEPQATKYQVVRTKY